MNEEHQRPDGVDGRSVAAAGKVSEAFEWIERARGRLYDFHQMIGRADFILSDAADELAAAGHAQLAEEVRREVIGRNVLDGRWTYQVVEEFDGGYYGAIRAMEEQVRNTVVDGRRHVYEAELKERRRTHGLSWHESEPPSRSDGHGA